MACGHALGKVSPQIHISPEKIATGAVGFASSARLSDPSTVAIRVSWFADGYKHNKNQRFDLSATSFIHGSPRTMCLEQHVHPYSGKLP